MFSRGMSQVSAMISATLSNVVDIRPALFGHGKDGRRPGPAHASPTVPGPFEDANAPYSEGCRQVQRRLPGAKVAPRPAYKPLGRLSDCGRRGARLALFQAAIGGNIALATARPDGTGTRAATGGNSCCTRSGSL